MPKPLKVAPFQNWKYGDAKKALEENLRDEFERAKAYCEEQDHFQNGEEWVGPGDPATNPQIEKQFAPEDAIGEVLSNVANAFAEPSVNVINAENEETDATKAVKAALKAWTKRQKLNEIVLDCVSTSAWAGFSDLRLWVPHRYLSEDGDDIVFPPATSLEEALKYIHVDNPSPDTSAIITDADTQDEVAVYLTEEVEWDEAGEHSTVYQRAELVFLDPERDTESEDPDTIVRIVYAEEDKKSPIEVSLQLGGRLLTSEMVSKILITGPVMARQRQFNFLNTLVSRMGETAAFRERYTQNAKPQGVRIAYTEGDSLPDGAFVERDDEGRPWAVIPQPRTLGANTTTELVGLPKYNDGGEITGNQEPGIFIADPVDPAPYTSAGESVRRSVMRMCSQGHLGGLSNAEASGIAYEQARAVFSKDLEKRGKSEARTLKDLYEAVLGLAEYILGNIGEYTEEMFVTVEQSVDAGPRSPDSVRLDLEGYEAGIISRPTTMRRFGVSDVEAEEARLDEEAKTKVVALKAVGELLARGVPAATLNALMPDFGLEGLTLPEGVENTGVDPVPPEGDE